METIIIVYWGFIGNDGKENGNCYIGPKPSELWCSRMLRSCRLVIINGSAFILGEWHHGTEGAERS